MGLTQSFYTVPLTVKILQVVSGEYLALRNTSMVEERTPPPDSKNPWDQEPLFGRSETRRPTSTHKCYGEDLSGLPVNSPSFSLFTMSSETSSKGYSFVYDWFTDTYFYHDKEVDLKEQVPRRIYWSSEITSKDKIGLFYSRIFRQKGRDRDY